MTQPELDAACLEIVLTFGGAGTYVSQVPGVYDPSTGSVVTSKIMTPVKVVLLDLNRPINGENVKAGTNILAGDKEAYMIPPNKTGGVALGTIQPTQDRLIVAGVGYTVITFKEVNPSGADPILYTLYLRR